MSLIPTLSNTAPPLTSRTLEGLDEKGSISRLQRYWRFVPLVGDFYAIHYGVDELRAARTPSTRANALVDLGIGINGAVQCTALVPLYAASFKHVAPTVLAVAGPIAAIAGGLSTFVDAGRDLVNGYTESDRGEIAAGLAKTACGLVSVVACIADNLPLIAASALVNIGITMVQNRDSVKGVARAAWQRLSVPTAPPAEP